MFVGLFLHASFYALDETFINCQNIKGLQKKQFYFITHTVSYSSNQA